MRRRAAAAAAALAAGRQLERERARPGGGARSLGHQRLQSHGGRVRGGAGAWQKLANAIRADLRDADSVRLATRLAGVALAAGIRSRPSKRADAVRVEAVALAQMIADDRRAIAAPAPAEERETCGACDDYATRRHTSGDVRCDAHPVLGEDWRDLPQAAAVRAEKKAKR